MMNTRKQRAHGSHGKISNRGISAGMITIAAGLAGLSFAFMLGTITHILPAAASPANYALVSNFSSSLKNTDTSSSRTATYDVPKTFTTFASVTHRYTFTETSKPVRLMIPSINVDAEVQPVGLSAKKDNVMAVTDSFWTVGWYKSGPVPGAAGNAVIEGHLDQVVSPYAVFFNLDKLKPGDMVEVADANGRTLQFTVTGSTVEPYDSPTTDIFSGASPGESRLALITCAGTWIQAQHQYNERLVVFTTRSD